MPRLEVVKSLPPVFNANVKDDDEEEIESYSFYNI